MSDGAGPPRGRGSDLGGREARPGGGRGAPAGRRSGRRDPGPRGGPGGAEVGARAVVRGAADVARAVPGEGAVPARRSQGTFVRLSRGPSRSPFPPRWASETRRRARAAAPPSRPRAPSVFGMGRRVSCAFPRGAPAALCLPRFVPVLLFETRGDGGETGGRLEAACPLAAGGPPRRERSDPAAGGGAALSVFKKQVGSVRLR